MTWFKRVRPALLFAVALALLAFGGCASCGGGACQAAEYDDGSVPPPEAPPKASPWPSRDRARDPFATPPERDPNAEPEPKLANDLPDWLKGKGLIVNQTGNGSVSINSPGAPVAPPAAAAFPLLARDAFATPPVGVVAPTVVTAPTTVATPIIPGPLTDSQYVGLFKRLGGAGYYALTGKCPTFPFSAARKARRAAAVVPVAGAAVVPTTSYAVIPTTSYAQVPVTSMATVPVTSYQAVPLPAQAPLYAVPQAAPQYAPQAAPQYAPQPPTPSPQASPQTLAAPRKASFSLFR